MIFEGTKKSIFFGLGLTRAGYVYHNGYKLDETKSSYIASEECDSLWEVITSVSGGDAKPISVIGINGKAEKR